MTEDFGRRIADGIDLPRYLVEAGVPPEAAQFYADKIRDRLVLLIFWPETAQYAEAQRLLSNKGLVNT